MRSFRNSNEISCAHFSCSSSQNQLYTTLQKGEKKQQHETDFLSDMKLIKLS